MEIGKTGVKIEFLGHSGFLISHENKKIVIDPYNISEKINEKADMILITHSHYDHCSIKDIEKLAKEGSIVACTPDSQSKIMKIEGINLQIVEAGDKISFGDIKVETIESYNKDKNYHPKSEGWVGYIIKLGNVTIYHAGDTDFIPEMQKLSGYGKHNSEFIALLPVSGKFVMDAEEATEAASIINPALAIPMHYGAGVAGTLEDAERFVELCKEKNINAKILEKL